MRGPTRPDFAQVKSLIFLDTRFFVDEYRAVFPVNVTSPSCNLTIGHIAALAGVSEQTVRNALRQAQALALLTIEERRRTAWVNYPNKVEIVSKEWATWLRLATGQNSFSPRSESKRRRENCLAQTRENIHSGSLFRQKQDPAEPEEGLSA